jgi:hypothetical protein
MDYTKEQTAALANVLCAKAKKVQDTDPDRLNPDVADSAECLRVLGRMVQGKSIHQAFGAPGDWGYGTPIGDALSALYKTPRAVAVPSVDPDCEISDADSGL